MTNKKFRIIIVGDLDYNDLVADIYFEDYLVAMLTQEEGFENLKILIYPPKNAEAWDFRFDELQEAMMHAKNRLWDLRLMPEE